VAVGEASSTAPRPNQRPAAKPARQSRRQGKRVLIYSRLVYKQTSVWTLATAVWSSSTCMSECCHMLCPGQRIRRPAAIQCASSSDREDKTRHVESPLLLYPTPPWTRAGSARNEPLHSVSSWLVPREARDFRFTAPVLLH